jgi:hypothetical protein
VPGATIPSGMTALRVPQARRRVSPRLSLCCQVSNEPAPAKVKLGSHLET